MAAKKSPTAVLSLVSSNDQGEVKLSTAGTKAATGRRIISYLLDLGDGSQPVALPGSPPAEFNYKYKQDGSYNVEWTVVDNQGATDQFELNVMIIIKVPLPPPAPPANTQPTAAIAKTAGTYAGDTFAFSFSASDAEGPIATWSFNPGDGSATINGTGQPPASRTHVYSAVAASRTASLTVTDSGSPALSRTVSVTFAVQAVVVPPAPTPITSSIHAYFNMMRSRPEHWRNYSLRDKAQIASYRQGTRKDVDYLFPMADYDVRRQDAAKVVIADYPNLANVTLTQPLLIGQTSMVSTGGLPANPGITYRIDNEVVAYVSRTTAGGITTTVIQRAQHGTLQADHASGAQVGTGTNSLQSQVRLPLNTVDGNDYFITWDAWYGAETRNNLSGLTNWKTWQFAQGTSGDGGLGLEVRNRMTYSGQTLAADEVCIVDLRRYLDTPDSPGDNITPLLAIFKVKAEKWTRYWVRIRHIAADYDLLDVWVADEDRDPVQIHSDIRFESSSHAFAKFWVEFNTSTDEVIPGRGPLTCYTRNFVALQNLAAATIPSLLVRPIKGGRYAVIDTFTTDVSHELSTHVSDNGTTWSISEQTGPGTPGDIFSASVLWKVADGRDWLSPLLSPGANMRASYVMNPPVALSANYYLEFPLTNRPEASSNRFLYGMVRCTAPGTFYGAGFYPKNTFNPDTFLFKVVGGVYTQLQATKTNWEGDSDVIGSASIFKLMIDGDHLQLFKDGVLLLEVHDSSISAAGKPGLGMGNIRPGTTDTTDSSMAISEIFVMDLGV